MSQKGLSTIGGLLIALLTAAVAAVGVWTFYTLTTADITDSESSNVVINSGKNSTSEATKDWKTYTNTKYGYFVKYPQDWEYSEDNTWEYSEDNTTKLVQFGNKNKPMTLEGRKSYPINITYYANASNLSWDQFFNGKNGGEDVQGYKNKSDITAGGKKSIKLTGVPGLLSYTDIIVPIDKAFIKIQKAEDSNPEYGVDTTYDKMVPTFGFTK